MNDPSADRKTREPQYKPLLDIDKKKGRTKLGLMANFLWDDDPRHLVFLLSRYKFVSKMMSGRNHVLEVGCGDSFGTRIVRQEVPKVTAVDFDPIFVEDGTKRMDEKWKHECRLHDILEKPVEGVFDGAYSLDVFEHIPPEKEDCFISNIAASLTDQGVLIIGSPSIQSQVHATPMAVEGHVNCKDQKELKAVLSRHFHNVFAFSMNDEVVHTGYHPMAQYLLVLACTKKK
jgi:SAM-dependent methyltransferase